MNRIFILCAFYCVCGSQLSYAGELYTGVWSGNPPAETSLEIISEHPLKVSYCYEGECNEFNPDGDVKKMTITMQPTADFAGATLTFMSKFGAYVGEYVYQNEGGRFFSRLKKIE